MTVRVLCLFVFGFNGILFFQGCNGATPGAEIIFDSIMDAGPTINITTLFVLQGTAYLVLKHEVGYSHRGSSTYVSMYHHITVVLLGAWSCYLYFNSFPGFKPSSPPNGGGGRRAGETLHLQEATVQAFRTKIHWGH